MTTYPRLMFAATASGSGKTIFSLAFLQAMKNANLRPAAFKCGPDYIDPMFHRELLNLPGYNLDLFFSRPEIVRGLFCRAADNVDISLIEGAMGMYDGMGDTSIGSSWHLAGVTETPIVLIVNPHGAFLSCAAMLQGFLHFREGSRIQGILLNQCSRKIHDRLAPVLEKETGLPVFGNLPNLPEAAISSRHLGLVTPMEVAHLRENISTLAREIEKHVDLTGLITLARSAPPLTATLPAPAERYPCRIGIAQDPAFRFYYQENLELLQSLGAELVYFSPMHDAALPEQIDALYLGGGYPELYAAELSHNASMRKSIVQALTSHMPVLAEGGGFMYLQQELKRQDGHPYPMCGALAGSSRPTGTLQRFGYATLTAQIDTLLLPKGETTKMREYHHWDSTHCGHACQAVKASGSEWQCTVASPRLFAGFPQLYFWSNPRMATRFVQAACQFRDGDAAWK